MLIVVVLFYYSPSSSFDFVQTFVWLWLIVAAGPSQGIRFVFFEILLTHVVNFSLFPNNLFLQISQRSGPRPSSEWGSWQETDLVWEEVQFSPWGGGHQDKRQVPQWEFEEDGEEEKSDERGGKTGEWTFSKKEVDGKEASWGTDKDLASEQEVGEDDRGGEREKKAANQANILNILSQLILEANEDKEDEEKEERQSRYPQSSNSSFCQSIVH